MTSTEFNFTNVALSALSASGLAVLACVLALSWQQTSYALGAQLREVYFRYIEDGASELESSQPTTPSSDR